MSIGSSQAGAAVVDYGVFDPTRPAFPHPILMASLLQSFFKHLQGHFPFLNAEVTMSQHQQRALSSLLENCIAAQAAP